MLQEQGYQCSRAGSLWWYIPTLRYITGFLPSLPLPWLLGRVTHLGLGRYTSQRSPLVPCYLYGICCRAPVYSNPSRWLRVRFSKWRAGGAPLPSGLVHRGAPVPSPISTPFGACPSLRSSGVAARWGRPGYHQVLRANHSVRAPDTGHRCAKCPAVPGFVSPRFSNAASQARRARPSGPVLTGAWVCVEGPRRCDPATCPAPGLYLFLCRHHLRADPSAPAWVGPPRSVLRPFVQGRNTRRGPPLVSAPVRRIRRSAQR
ncbi:hypothetical protein NDU88_007536 [Pleurodeles waltl]|uniref:Uncharacterized protein n=1 Tax=Pleurodeles waltl TaxID=8319 RepID=A0AAV7QL19_PLEWA|nr:hypothetical protein NDU88_007536 [Pleurodeles waltl]